jgi:CheY-like chemotaxis protein
MDPETLAHASEPFFTTKSLGQGTGLGLTMARSFAEGSAGRLVITSEPDRGTEVSLWLPAVAEAARTRPVRSLPVAVTDQPHGRSPLRILLVDDDASVREILAALLKEEGYKVTEAEDVPSALHFLELGQSVDLLISDLAMPGPDGMVLIREAQRRQPSLPAILITGYAGDAAELAIGRAVEGRFTLLRKPVNGAQLVDQVAAAAAFSPD